MKKIMKVKPEKDTNKWFTELPAIDRVKGKELQQAREGITNRHQKAVPAIQWWFRQNHVRKSEVYKMYAQRFKSQSKAKPKPKSKSQSESKSNGDKAPSKIKEVKENGK